MTTFTRCSQAFEVTDADREFYNDIAPTFNGKKYPIPEPAECPACRMQRRLNFRNFFHLYHRTCDLSGKRIISMYDQDAAFPVYEMHEWWSDKWDALDYGIDPDFEKSIFDQLKIIHETVPRMSIMNTLCENTDYCNFSFQSKNCYLIGGNVVNEDCCYGHIVWQSKDCFDCLYVYRCERCYECTDCFESYDLAYSRACENCTSSRFLVHCSSCKDCFGCVGLKNKQYCMFNEQLSKEEYEKRMIEFNPGSQKMITVAQQKIEELIGSEVVKHYHGVNCEDVTGDYLYNSKNVEHSFDVKNCEDCKYLATAETFLHCHDCNFSPAKTEWSYNCLTVNGYHLLMCHTCVNGASDLIWCDTCPGSKNCFGCYGLKSKQYCIFNKQYTQEEYEELVPQLIEHAQQTGEWGQFFLLTMSPFGYNETMAHEYFPLTKEEVEKQGWKWKDQADDDNYMGPTYELPDDIKDVPDDVTDQILRCSVSEKPFKIIPQELEFHKEMNLPLPRACFLERHRTRMQQRNPRQLFDRTCQECGKEIRTTYEEGRPEKVLCEKCYLSSVY